MKSIVLCIVLFLSNFCLYSQKGRVGDHIISAEIIVNAYTPVIRSLTSGDQEITVQSNQLLGTFFSTPLEGGDLIMIYQAQGANINETNTENYGEVDDYNSSGYYDLVQVAKVSGNQQIILDCPLSHDYDLTGNVQVIRVPRFNNLTVSESGVISCPSWNGQTAGLVVLEVKEELILNGEIKASFNGFRGGVKENNQSDIIGLDYLSNNPADGGRKGEGISGYQLVYGRGAKANGGGGGNGQGAGGAGGSNVEEFVSNYFGHGVPNQFVVGAQAWALEDFDVLSNPSNGGGRGGYSSADNDMNALVFGPDDIAWGASNRLINGGLGGRALEMDSERLFFGGGGGAGANQNLESGSGGAGGGIVFIESFGEISGNGIISVNGEDGEDGLFASGGGGAAGSIYVNTRSTISGIEIEAIGGSGGNQLSNSIACGPGGGGTGGLVCLSNNISTVIASGRGGISNSSLVDEFLSNGATDGNPGLIKADLTNYEIIGETDTVCKGTNIIQVAQFDGILPPGSDIAWYDAPFGGNVIQVGNSINISSLQSDTIVYLSVCPSSYREAYGYYVDQDALANAGNDTLTCAGTSLNLMGAGGVQYTWEPADKVDDAFSSSPLISITEDQMFYLEIVAENGCTDKDSVFVEYVDQLDLTVFGAEDICFGENHVISVEGANTYTWSGPNVIEDLNDSAIVSPVNDTIYFVEGFNNAGCRGYDSVQVNVFEQINYELTNDTTICSDNCIGLNLSVPNAGFGEFSIVWNETTFTSGLFDCITKDTTHLVQLTNNFTSCVIQDSVEILLSKVDYNISTTDLCIGSNTSLTNESTSYSGIITNVFWDFDNGEQSLGDNFNFTFSSTGYYPFNLMLEDTFGCSFSFRDSIFINSLPESEIVLNDEFYCQGDSILMYNANQELDSVIWFSNYVNIGNGDSIYFDEGQSGQYQLFTQVWSNGCLDTIHYQNSIEVLEASIADFTIVNPGDTIRPFEIIELSFNGSAETFEWEFQNESSDEIVPEFISEQEGDYCITLITNNSNNCPDTSVVCIPFYDNLELIVSNTITPNGDGFNDEFIIDGTKQFTLHINIYNRWGTLVYSSDDYQNDFIGQDKNGNELEGTFYFVIQAEENSNVSSNGFLSIFR